MTPRLALESAVVARHETLLLLAHATGRTRESLLADPATALTAADADRFADLVERRVAGVPIAYLIARREFYGRRFHVDSRVLIPRPETELLVDAAVAWLTERSTGWRPTTARPLAVADLGTGSGVVAITLALECPGIDVVATDRSADALQVAATNATSLAAAVRFVASDWYAAFGRDGPDATRFDLIVSNPPYIAAGDRHLGEGDLRFEPSIALTDGADGLAALRRIVAGAPAHLAASGALMVEHGHDQAAAVRTLCAVAGLVRIESRRDLAGIERITVGHAADAAG